MASPLHEPRIRPGLHVALALGVTDVACKVLSFAAYEASLGVDPAVRQRALACYVVAAPLSVAIYFGCVFALGRPIDRFWVVPTPAMELVRRVARRIDAIPSLVAWIAIAQWTALFVGVTLRLHEPIFAARTLCLLAANALSVPLMLDLMARAVMNRAYVRAAQHALDGGYSLELPQRSLGTQLAYAGFAMCGAPAAFLAGLVFSIEARPELVAQLRPIMVAFVVPVPIFWLVTARFMAKTVTLPVSRLAEAVRLIGQTGDVVEVRAIPVLQQDELGRLTSGANAMIARLAQAERDRGHALAELGQLNTTLEQRVEDEMHARARIEIDLRQAQKLESVGRLAAGVAHEINSPVQFIGDSVTFVKEAMHDCLDIIARQDALLAIAPDDPRRRVLTDELADAKEAADLEYLVEHAPKALVRAADGVARVAGIVRAMKEFAYPNQREMSYGDLNRAVESTTIVAKNEYKYVAELECELSPLPPVLCHLGELNQVVLNLIVNASHAIEDRVKAGATRGLITVRTRLDGGDVVLSVQDTGGGIPAAIRESIFDPFFTTKGVGRGTGQGLAIARSVVVEKHGGQLTFESTIGEGTTFFVRLPVDRSARRAA